jgi:7-keto-8-aminopelargonate synthetase-like enzyme
VGASSALIREWCYSSSVVAQSSGGAVAGSAALLQKVLIQRARQLAVSVSIPDTKAAAVVCHFHCGSWRDSAL